MKDIKEYKKDLVEKLEDAGIPDVGFTLKEALKSKNNYLGWYKGGSQLRSRPIIYIDISKHVSELQALGEDNLDQTIMDTMLHEYGHVIEEFVAFDNRVNGNSVWKILQENFNDMEDFAELFAKYINQDVFIPEAQHQAIENIINFYVKEKFTPYALEEIKKPRWMREINELLHKFEKSNEKLQTQEGSFNKCLATCDAFFDRMTDKSDIKILRLEGYSATLENAHPMWQKFKDKDFIVHYVLAYRDTIVDLTAKQFDKDAKFPQISSLGEICGIWEQVEEHKVKNSPPAAKIPRI